MGAGAAAGLSAALQGAKEEEVAAALASLSAEDQAKIAQAMACPVSGKKGTCPCSGMNGAGLPDGMTAETVDMIAATAGAVAPKALDITSAFYTGMIADHTDVVLSVFNPAHNLPISDHQPKALANAVVAYASNIKDLAPLLVPGGAVDAINHRHCALGIQPAHYPVVHDHVMASIGQTLGAAVTEDVAKAWSEAIRFLAKVCIDKEEALYQAAAARKGGWRGQKDFTISEIVDVAADTKSFTFTPVEPLADGFEFHEGQYLSLRVDPEGNGLTAPRHYTITSAPGEKFLQCTMKKVKGGKVSTFMHDNVKVGDTLKLAPPFGVFSLDHDVPSAVLMSAGIGVTPMMAFSRNLQDKVKLTVHVDKNPDAYAFRSHFESSGEKFIAKYTQVDGAGRPTAEALAKEAVEKAGAENIFYICGPEAWMTEVQSQLLKLGAKKVMCEVFGSQLATGCPFAAGA